MTDYDNTNRFTLFKNDKQGNESRPDYTGSINVDGRELKLSAWIKKSKDGTKTFMSGTVQEPYNQPNVQQDAAQADLGASEPDNDGFSDPLPGMLSGVDDSDVPF